MAGRRNNSTEQFINQILNQILKKMKKIKLMLIAFVAMISVTAFAQDYATTVFRYTVTGGTEATINGFDAEYSAANQATVTIPAQVANPTNSNIKYDVKAIAPDAFKNNANIKKVVIEATKLTTIGNSFVGCSNLEEIDLTKCTNLTSISAGAFKGTKIAELDLSKSKLTTIPNLFGTTFGYEAATKYTAEEAAAYNAKLTGAKKEGDPIPGKEKNYTEAEAKAFNATLPGAVELGDVKEKARKYTEAEVLEHNYALEGAVGQNVVITDEHVTRYETAYGTEDDYVALVAGEKFTKEQAEKYNATLDGAVTTESIKEKSYYTNQDEVDAYNAALLGAVTTENVNPETSGKYTAESAAAYNSHLTGAVDTDDINPASAITAVPNNTLKSVTLPATCETISASAFENCTKLATLPFVAKLTTIGKKAFLGTALKSLDFTGTNVSKIPANLIIDQDRVEENTTLASVTLNDNIQFISPKTFMNCINLKEFNFPEEYGEGKVFKAIYSYALANTAIESIVLPSNMGYTTERVSENAFYGCESLKSFTYMPEGTPTDEVVNELAFPGCSGITYYTTNENVLYYKDNDLVAPKNTKFSVISTGKEPEFTTVQYANNSGKYYIKYKAVTDIKVKKSEAKVYNAYTDEGDNTLNMLSYKAKSSYYNIKKGDVVLIITSKKDLAYENQESAPETGSLLPTGVKNALNLVLEEDGIARAELDYLAGKDKSVYGWVNSKEKGTGFLKITSGEVFPYGTMYVFAAEPKTDAARLNVRWIDENGNVEDETTAIQNVQTVGETENGEVYNLQGVRVNGAQKGIFIKNGKKYIVK